MTIHNLSPTKINVYDTGNLKIVDYGVMTKGSDSTVEILLEEEGQKITYASHKICACTKVFSTNEDGKIRVSIKYDTKLVGDFGKPLNYYYSLNGKQQLMSMQIKGKVK